MEKRRSKNEFWESFKLRGLGEEEEPVKETEGGTRRKIMRLWPGNEAKEMPQGRESNQLWIADKPSRTGTWN